MNSTVVGFWRRPESGRSAARPSGAGTCPLGTGRGDGPQSVPAAVSTDVTVRLSRVDKTIRGKRVLDGATAMFAGGKVHGLVGVNGSGKTMLLRAVCGLIRLDAGVVTIGGRMVRFNEALPIGVGVLIETPGFNERLSGYDNLRYLAGLNHAFDRDETRRLLRRFGLWRFRSDPVRSYSLGMRQKLAIVQALMEHQRLVLLDEPTNGLDRASVEAFLGEMEYQRSHGTTVLIATHHGDELQGVADTIHRMDAGRLVC